MLCYNALDFTSANFETQAGRDMLMSVMCEATQVSTGPVHVQCP